MAKKYSDKIIFVLFCLVFLPAVWTRCSLAQSPELSEPLIPAPERPADVPPEAWPEYAPPEAPAVFEPAPPSSPLSQLPQNEEFISKEIRDTGEQAISLDLRGIEISELLKVLSKKLNKNIIPSRRVTGRINLFLNNITYSDVLDVIILSQGLAYEKKGEDIIMVMTAAEYEALYGEKFNEKREIKTLKLKHTQPKLVFNALTKLKSTVGNVIVDEVTGTVILIDTPEKLKSMQEAFANLDKPLVTEAFELQYAKAVDIKESISSIITTGAGKVIIDERTNSLVITDLSGNMNRIKQAINLLDQETRQVFIEAEILELTLRDRLQFGIDWQKVMRDPSYRSLTYKGEFSTSLSNYQEISAGVLTDDRFNVTMQFLNTLGDTKILSRPKIAVTNDEEATIMVGTREAYVTGTTSQSGESTITSDTVEFVDVGVKLKVVPSINRDGFITMKIKPEVSSVSSTLTTGTTDEPRSQIPIVSTSEAETTVKVKDGAMIMIAGLRKNKEVKDVSGIPYLSKIPIIGTLFSKRDSDQYQTEIIIFLTPHIIKGEEMMSWDREKIKAYPKQVWPESKEYIESQFEEGSLKKSTKLKEAD